jgi:hypothetical protein
VDVPRVAITALTVTAFVLSAWGIIGAIVSTTTHARKVNAQRRLRSLYTAELSRKTALAQRIRNGGDRERASRLQDAALETWRRRHREIGMEPWSYHHINTGRELLAESLLDELVSGTRRDALLVGFGLVAGLVASVWSIWLDA